jgi:hypothetical protein
MNAPGIADALQAGIRLARALNAAGVRLREVDATTDPVRVVATATAEDVERVAALIEEHAGLPPGPTAGEGVFRAHAAAMRLVAAARACGVELEASGAADGSGVPMVYLTATPADAEQLAALVEESSR